MKHLIITLTIAAFLAQPCSAAPPVPAHHRTTQPSLQASWDHFSKPKRKKVAGMKKRALKRLKSAGNNLTGYNCRH